MKIDNKHTIDFELLFDSAPDLYLVLDPDFNIVGVNHAYLKATMVKQKDIIGKHIFEVFPDNPYDIDATGESNLRASLNRVVEQHVADTMAVQKYDIRMPESEGGQFQERYWSPINIPILKNGVLYYILHRVEDVTPFVLKDTRASQMERDIYYRAQEIQEANNRLRAVNEELNAFSYMISHDLRAPLRAIDGFSRIISEDYGPQLQPEARSLLSRICYNVRHMGQLIDDLLTFARLNRAVVEKKKLNMRNLFEQVFSDLKEIEGEIKLNLEVASLPQAFADQTLIKQVIFNLCQNAVKYSKEQPVINIQVGFEDKKDETIYWIKDNGIGFDMRFIDKLCIPFQKLHDNKNFESTGIGLAIVERILNRHNGRIWAQSELGKGATFYFSLPKEAPQYVAS